jgi:2-polyprenyl-6-hydroxyphenyl methylase/3-demethylubiquinone-9 3-methyltransferase
VVPHVVGPVSTEAKGFDHSTRAEFVRYYADKSLQPETLAGLVAARDLVLRFAPARRPLDVADVGCGAGAHSLLWAQLGHRVHGVDVSAELVDLARRRALEAGYTVDCSVGSATALPWSTGSMDVCLLLELLEHVADWARCLDECARVLRPRGVLLVSTTNALCPVQQEFSLPLYSWYPAPLKRHYAKLAATTRPEIAGYATYPAVNWFTFYSLRAALAARGLSSLDRFDVMDERSKGAAAATVVRALRRVPVLRWLGHVATPYTLALAVKS